MPIEALSQFKFVHSNIWVPSRGLTSKEMTNLGLSPLHISLISSIKRVGQEALGDLFDFDQNRTLATYDQLDNFVRRFPWVEKAISDGVLTPDDFLDGITNKVYVDDNIGYDKICHLFPSKTKAGMRLKSQERIPIEEIDLSDKTLSQEEKVRLINKNNLLWVFLARYLNLEKVEGEYYLDSFDFFKIVKENNLGIYLLNSGIEMFDFQLVEPWFEEQELTGTISIRAASLFQAGVKSDYPRVILFYNLERKFSEEAKIFANNLFEKHT